MSADGGNTWNTVDTYPSVSNGADWSANGVGTDLHGHVVVVGQAAATAGGPLGWFARSSPTGAEGSWQTLNAQYLDTGAVTSGAGGVVTDAEGNLLVTGHADFQTGNSLVSHWIVRKGVLTP